MALREATPKVVARPPEPEDPAGPTTAGPNATDTDPTGNRSSRRRDLLCISILVSIPVLVFGGADVFGGHLLLAGDNLIQNYPLRVLVGSDLRHGVLPLWNPYIWSGSPLMAGLNAGAFYPTTLLFALSAHVAWVVGQIFVFASVATGTYLLFRSGGSTPLASFLAAFSFSFAGAIAAQTAAHIDMGDGLATLPWALLAIRKIADDGRWRWMLLLGGAGLLTILSGSPEAMLDTAAACAAFAVFRFLKRRATIWQYLSRLAGSGLIALGLSAFFWIPALHFIASTQRPSAGEGFASEFSFPASASVLGVVPYLEGGYSLFSQPPFFGQSNIEEVVVYVGILPVIAALALLTPAWRRRLPRGEVLCWYGILLVGVVLATGAQSPLEHLLYHIPFYGRQRDTGRNIVDVDLALCALFALWIDGRPRHRKHDRPRFAWLENVAALLPFGVVGFVGILFLLSPTVLWIVVRASPPLQQRSAGSGAAIVLAGVVTVCGALLVVFRERIGRVAWRRLVGGFVVVDIGLFSLGSGYLSAEQPPDPAHPTAVVDLVKANLSDGGRYAVFNPALLNENRFVDSAEPDLGILYQLPSFSGYGAVANAAYASETGSQARGYLNVSSLADGSFEQLGLQVLVTPPESFLIPVASVPGAREKPRVLSEQPGSDAALPGGNSPPQRPPLMNIGQSVPRDVLARSVSGWWFGTTLSVGSVAVEAGDPGATSDLQVGIVSAGGAVRWVAGGRLEGGGPMAMYQLGGLSGEGLEIRSSAGLRSVRVFVSTSKGRHYLLSGALSDAVTPRSWTEAGSADDFTVFKANYSPSSAWIQEDGTESQPVVGGVPSLGTARVVSETALATTVDSHTHAPALLIWNEAWDSGWRAELEGPVTARPLEVRRVGLLQGVEVPAGTSVVRFTYQPSGLVKGFVVSATTGVLLAVTLMAFVVSRRRRSARTGSVVAWEHDRSGVR